MKTHPIGGSTVNRFLGGTLVIAAEAFFYFLLLLYGDLSPTEALVDSLTFMAVQTVCAYIYGFLVRYLRSFPLKILAPFVITLIGISGTYIVTFSTGLIDNQVFIKNIPLHIMMYTLLLWGMIASWYNAIENHEAETETIPIPDPAEDRSAVSEYTDHISVKDGSRLHIVRTEELIHIQAYGNYVILFSDKGKFIKEQTMKATESILPPSFIRIHRSHIVNSNRIVRVELLGKESYNVHLSDGSCIKASSSGYKLLKQRLAL